MPSGLCLRSSLDWHIDADNKFTMRRCIEELNLSPQDFEPIKLRSYIQYADWFRSNSKISVEDTKIDRLDHQGGVFSALPRSGPPIEATHVVVAVGLRYFPYIPECLAELLPADRVHHSSEIVDFHQLRGSRVLIVGGRQSAFEWAALIHESGAKEVHLSYRHEKPLFTKSDWSWLEPILEQLPHNPDWFRNLSCHDRELFNDRVRKEGRLKLEPWLAQRISKETIFMHPKTEIVGVDQRASGELNIHFNNCQDIRVDHVVFATGFKIDLNRIPFMYDGNLLDKVDMRDGSPVLDSTFQSSIKGLFFTGAAAIQEFGPLFAFTATTRVSSSVIGNAIAAVS